MGPGMPERAWVSTRNDIAGIDYSQLSARGNGLSNQWVRLMWVRLNGLSSVNQKIA